jgi:predicted dehydrogenase
MIRSGKLSRRRFLKRSAAVAAGAVAAPMFIPSSVLARDGKPGANDIINVGVIGTGNRSRMLMDQLPAPGRIVAISDCYIKRMDETMTLKKKQWPCYQDYRKMLEKEHLDAVLVPTTDHGRPLPCIHACQAGLDVYAEKPLATTIEEGKAMLAAARHYKRVFQVGSQQRTMEFNRYACELVRTGGIGKVTSVIAQNYSGPVMPEGLAEEAIPEGDDWSMWSAGTPLLPFNNKLQFGWMHWRPYSGGEMTNWGAHGVDQIQWALGMDGTGPVELWPMATGLSGNVSMRYANGVTVNFDSTKAPMGGAIFIGEKGKLSIDRNGFEVDPPELAVNPPPQEKKHAWVGPGWIATPHIANWLDCIKTRKTPNADVEIGHRSISVCHLVNITRELGRKVQWDPKTETFVNDAQANTYLSRPRRKGFELPTIV